MSDAATRQALLRLIERPRVPLAPSVSAQPSPGPGLESERFTFAAEAGERVSGLFIQASGGSGPRPALVVAHGTGGSKEAVLPLLSLAAARGFIAVAIDARYHGERAGRPEPGAAVYLEAILEKFRTGRGLPFLYDTVWDLMRLFDLLEQRSEIDPARVALLGISKGGMETYLTAAADPRWAVAIPVLGAQSYGYGLAHDAWRSRVETIQGAFAAAAHESGVAQPDAAFVRHFYDRVVPGIYSDFDGPRMLPLIAPRPLLVINGELDVRTPGLELCRRETVAAYTRVGAAEACQIHVQSGVGHEFAPAAIGLAFAWLERWLRPAHVHPSRR
jgi:dienelactone hydrolase